MTRTRYTITPGDPAPYFLTASTVNWLPLFSNPDIAAIVIDSLRYLITFQRIRLYAFVIMENHVHLIADALDLAKEMKDFKSFTSHTCIEHYRKNNNQFILDQLMINKLQHKTDRAFQFWQEGSHPERIDNEVIFQQKVEYIHYNPVKRGYVDLPEHWCYSSARNYAGMDGLLPIVGVDVEL